MKTGVIDVGGGLRGIYACGVFDYCIKENIHFDLGIGISAGSANLLSYVANQYKRNYVFYTEYAFRKQYMSIHNYLVKKSYVNLDYVYSDLSNNEGEYPLDYKAVCENQMEWYVVATNALNGEPKYFSKKDMKENQYDMCKASSAIPFVCQPYFINGIPYYDGALADCVPLIKAFEKGCDKVVLILTKPENYVRNSKKDDMIASLIHHTYPNAANKLKRRAKVYNDNIKLAQELVKLGKVLILAPDDTCGVDTLKKDKEAMTRLYEKGFQNAKQIKDFLKNE